jgi:hypothetical protein
VADATPQPQALHAIMMLVIVWWFCFVLLFVLSLLALREALAVEGATNDARLASKSFFGLCRVGLRLLFIAPAWATAGQDPSSGGYSKYRYLGRTTVAWAFFGFLGTPIFLYGAPGN